MHTTRRAALALPFLALGGTALAQDAFPTRSIRLVVSFAPGGAADVVARLLAPRLGERLGQNVVVENRAGGSGTLAGAAVAQAAPDGHTLLWDGFSHVVNPLLLRGLAFDYATAFAPVTLVAQFPQSLAVKAGSPYQDIRGFIAAARANPGGISVGFSGNGTASHMLVERFRHATGAPLNAVPYRGAGDTLRDISAGTLDAAVLAISTSTQLEGAGRAKVLGVATAERIPARPGVPTLIESGLPGFVLSDMAAVFAPAGTPDAVRERLHGAIAATLAEPEVKARFDQLVILPGGAPPAEFAAWIERSRAEMAALVREANIRVE
ncbi:Bug family tripartite tricarboxylate transporter substrate binding protein [Falsiroseomonas sp. CW058]|uniref:Bug family tripartite tricarboxylate transporter substrate binding protein n=1 Tax=Falsiroseomonas sp. CW058 TaxID=3388664 RepID=UPI003D31DC94